MSEIQKSQVATEGGKITNSNNINDNENSSMNNSAMIKKIRTESVIISFIVGLLSSIVGSYLYEHFMK